MSWLQFSGLFSPPLHLAGGVLALIGTPVSLSKGGEERDMETNIGSENECSTSQKSNFSLGSPGMKREER